MTGADASGGQGQDMLTKSKKGFQEQTFPSKWPLGPNFKRSLRFQRANEHLTCSEFLSNSRAKGRLAGGCGEDEDTLSPLGAAFHMGPCTSPRAQTAHRLQGWLPARRRPPETRVHLKQSLQGGSFSLKT